MGKITYYRLKNGWSQSFVAERIGVSRIAVANWEQGRNKPSIENILAMAKLFGVTVEELVGDQVKNDDK